MQGSGCLPRRQFSEWSRYVRSGKEDRVNRGKVVFLNGASSSGKTTLAKQLQEMLDEPYLRFSIDEFLRMLPEAYISGRKVPELPSVVPTVASGMHRCIAAAAEAGNNIIVDHVLQAHQWLEECISVLTGHSVLFVGVHCPLVELEATRNSELSIRDRSRTLSV